MFWDRHRALGNRPRPGAAAAWWLRIRTAGGWSEPDRVAVTDAAATVVVRVSRDRADRPDDRTGR